MEISKKTDMPSAYPYYTQTEKNFSFAQMLANKSRLFGDQPAFSWKEKNERKTRTFRELEADVHALKQELMQAGVQGCHAGLVMENSYTWIVLFLALALSGNTAAAINPALPAKEVQAMLEQADCTLWFSSAAWKEAAGLPDTGWKDAGRLAAWLEQPHPQTVVKEQPGLDPDRLCAIYFTSGTTGQPKAVMLTERNMISDIDGSCAIFTPGIRAKTVSVLPFYHSFGFITAILMPLNYGCETFLCTSLRRLMPVLTQEKPQTVFMVPLMVETIHRRLIQMARKKGSLDRLRQGMQQSDALLQQGKDMRSILFSEIQQALGGRLEYIICGGAFLENSLIRDFHSWGIEVLAGYGITECSPVASVNRNRQQKEGSAGCLVYGLKARADENHEILLQGDMVFSGYYKDPETTLQAFRDGWFLTGDLGYVDEDGFLFLTGRSKNLIILANGENISPEQIEMDLMQLPGIQEVLVYEEQGKITAEIFPEEEYIGKQEDVQMVVDTWNQAWPIDHRVQNLKIRSVPFTRNASQKVIRDKS